MLVVDASVLVGELLRATGRARLADERLELFMAEHAAGEVAHELPRRTRRFGAKHGLPVDQMDQLVQACFDAIDVNVVIVAAPVYAPPRGRGPMALGSRPRRLAEVAAAMTIDAAVWTEDGDFLGTGVATWTTATVQGWLQRQPEPETKV